METKNGVRYFLAEEIQDAIFYANDQFRLGEPFPDDRLAWLNLFKEYFKNSYNIDL